MNPDVTFSRHEDGHACSICGRSGGACIAASFAPGESAALSAYYCAPCVEQMCAVLAMLGIEPAREPSVEEKLLFIEKTCVCFSMEVNEHRAVYEAIADRLDDDRRYRDMSDEERTRVLESGTVYMMQVYPATPVGFFSIAGATLGGVVDHVYREMKKRCDSD